jgi:MFS family permease
VNPGLLVAFASCQFALFPIPIITLFWRDQIGMSLSDVMLLQAVFSLAVVLFEFPSGYFADRIGYRKSLLVGTSLLMVGWSGYVLGASFGAIAAAEVVLGAGSAFMSGADRALLWVTLDAAGRAREYPRWEGRVRATSQTSEAVSAAAGGWLYALSPRLPFWLQIPAAMLAFGAAAAVREPGRPSTAQHSHLHRALSVARQALWQHRRLRAAIAVGVVLGLSSFVMVWLIQPYMQSRGISPAWFGPLWAAAHAWMAAVSLASARVAARLGVRATLLGCCLLVLAGYAGLALSASAWGVTFYLCFMTLRGIQAPVLMSVLQQEAPGEDRASVLSLAALFFRLSFVVAGPPIGALVDRVGMETALGTLGAVFTAAGLGAVIAFARTRRSAAAMP